ncbi:MAG: hypothetical protein IKE17_02600 [Clostridia bacterium]|nr:hypothetical protein [Clostridia bacterium]
MLIRITSIPAVLNGVRSSEMDFTLPRAIYVMMSNIVDVPPLMPSTGDSTVASL